MDQTEIDHGYVSPPQGFFSPQGAARHALNWILKRSIEHRHEWGGVICRQRGRYYAMPPQTQKHGNTVDVGLHQPKTICPAGATLVAYYHTHPNFSLGDLSFDYNHFSEQDMAVTDGGRIEAYLGTVDGSFLKYDPKHPDKPIHLDGRLRNSDAPEPAPPRPRHRRHPAKVPVHPVVVQPLR